MSLGMKIRFRVVVVPVAAITALLVHPSLKTLPFAGKQCSAEAVHSTVQTDNNRP